VIYDVGAFGFNNVPNQLEKLVLKTFGNTIRTLQMFILHAQPCVCRDFYGQSTVHLIHYGRCMHE